MGNKRRKISDKKLRKMVRNNIKHNRNCDSMFWTGGYRPDLVHFTDLDLRDCDISHANLSGTEFTNCDLRGAKFGRSCLCGANFLGCDLEGAGFYDTNLSHSDFTESNLFNVNFSHSRLTFSTWNELTVKDSTFYLTDLSHVRLTKVKLIEGEQDLAILFEDANLSRMRYDDCQPLPVARLNLDGESVTISKQMCYIAGVRFKCKRLLMDDANDYVVGLFRKIDEILIIDEVQHLIDWWLEYGWVVIDCVKALRRGAKKAKVSE